MKHLTPALPLLAVFGPLLIVATVLWGSHGFRGNGSCTPPVPTPAVFSCYPHYDELNRVR